MTLTEWENRITTNPILTWRDCNDLREVLNAESQTVSKLEFIFGTSVIIDFTNSATEISEILISESLNYLFQDSTTSEENNQVDWIELATGDRFIKYLNMYAVPIVLKKNIFLTIEKYVQNNLSIVLAEAITNSKTE